MPRSGLRLGACLLALTAVLLPAPRALRAGGPVIRVGIAAGEAAVRFTAPEGGIVCQSAAAALLAAAREGEAMVARLASYTVRVGEFSSFRMARFVAGELASAAPRVVVDREGESFCVDAGRYRTPDDARRAARGMEGWHYGVATGRHPAREAAGLQLLAADGSGTALLSGPVHVSAASPGACVRVGADAYRGLVRVEREPGGFLRLVNLVPLEEYLRGVVPREMPASWPLEALKAQAVAARTYAVAQLGRHAKEGYDLCATVHCQVYGGRGSEDPRADVAVRGTQGLVGMFGGGYANMVYHAHAGGRTDSSEDVWQAAVPYLRGVQAPQEGEYSWVRVYTRREMEVALEAAIRKAVGDPDIVLGTLREVTPRDLTPAGRARKVRVVGTGGSFDLSTGRFVGALGGGNVIRSWMFQVTPVEEVRLYVVDMLGARVSGVAGGSWTAALTGDAWGMFVSSRLGGPGLFPVVVQTREVGYFIVHGKGYGHGVGMSQWGAYGMAKAGYEFSRILQHYYRGISLVRKY